MRHLLVVVDNNVNARIICEVLLEARGETCWLCSQHKLEESLSHLRGEDGVTLVDANLADPTEQHKLQLLVETIKLHHKELAMVLVTEKPEGCAPHFAVAWPKSVLHPKNVGATLLATVDSLRAQLGTAL